jgi:negative regulator of replication initiation
MKETNMTDEHKQVKLIRINETLMSYIRQQGRFGESANDVLLRLLGLDEDKDKKGDKE